MNEQQIEDCREHLGRFLDALHRGDGDPDASDAAEVNEISRAADHIYVLLAVAEDAIA